MAGVLAGLGPAGRHRHLDFILCTVGPDLRQRTGNVLFCIRKAHSGCSLERRLVQLRKNRGTLEEDI